MQMAPHRIVVTSNSNPRSEEGRRWCMGLVVLLGLGATAHGER
jgi:hypothetical protein